MGKGARTSSRRFHGFQSVSDRDREIAAEVRAGASATVLAVKYGVVSKTIRNIVIKVRDAEFDAKFARKVG